jgi:hypothetical protein
MRFHWSSNTYPELVGLSKDQQKLALGYAHSKCLRNRRWWFGTVVCGFVPLLGASVAGSWGSFFGSLLGSSIAFHLFSGLRRKFIAEFLAEQCSWSPFPHLPHLQDSQR